MSDTYSFLDVKAAIVGFGGGFSLGDGAGVAEEGITIDPTTDINTMTNGADGSVMHSLHANKSGRAVVRLLKTSPTNALLSAMYNLQTASGALHGRNTITIANSSSGDVITCRKTAFKKAPTINYAIDGGLIEWEFDVGIVDRVLGNLSI